MNKIAETNGVFKEDKVYLMHRTVQSTSPWSCIDHSADMHEQIYEDFEMINLDFFT